MNKMNPCPHEAIRDWNDLRKHGINCLTGEACGLGMRLLCDLTEQGVETIKAFFGADLQLAENWNSGGVASCMLPRSILKDLAAFCLIREGAEIVVDLTDSVCATDSETLERWREECPEHVGRVYYRSGNACGGTRNRHQMSGRAA